MPTGNSKYLQPHSPSARVVSSCCARQRRSSRRAARLRPLLSSKEALSCGRFRQTSWFNQSLSEMEMPVPQSLRLCRGNFILNPQYKSHPGAMVCGLAVQGVRDVLGRQPSQAQRGGGSGGRPPGGAHGRAKQRHGPAGSALPVGVAAAPRHSGRCASLSTPRWPPRWSSRWSCLARLPARFYSTNALVKDRAGASACSESVWMVAGVR